MLDRDLFQAQDLTKLYLNTKKKQNINQLHPEGRHILIHLSGNKFGNSALYNIELSSHFT